MAISTLEYRLSQGVYWLEGLSNKLFVCRGSAGSILNRLLNDVGTKCRLGLILFRLVKKVVLLQVVKILPLVRSPATRIFILVRLLIISKLQGKIS